MYLHFVLIQKGKENLAEKSTLAASGNRHHTAVCAVSCSKIMYTLLHIFVSGRSGIYSSAKADLFIL